MSNEIGKFLSENIRKGKKSLENKGNLFFIYGKAGAGKTTFCQNIGDKRVLFISTESGNTDKFMSDNVYIIDINYSLSQYIKMLEEKNPNYKVTKQDKIELKIGMIENALDLAWDSRDNFDAIVIDSMTDVVNIFYYNREYYTQKAYIERTGDTQLKRYKQNNFAIFEEIVKYLFELVEKFKIAGVNFVMLFLEIQDEDSKTIIPYIVGQAYKKQIAGQPDFLLYVENAIGNRKIHVRDGINSVGLKFNAKTRRDVLNKYTPEELCDMGLGGVLEII